MLRRGSPGRAAAGYPHMSERRYVFLMPEESMVRFVGEVPYLYVHRKKGRVTHG